MDKFREELKKYILDYAYYDDDKKVIAIVNREELAKLLKVDEVRFEE